MDLVSFVNDSTILFATLCACIFTVVIVVSRVPEEG